MQKRGLLNDSDDDSGDNDASFEETQNDYADREGVDYQGLPLTVSFDSEFQLTQFRRISFDADNIVPGSQSTLVAEW